MLAPTRGKVPTYEERLEQGRRNIPEGFELSVDGLEMSIFPDVPVADFVGDKGVLVRDSQGPVRYGKGGPLPTRANVIAVTVVGTTLPDALAVAELAYVASTFGKDTVVVFGAPAKKGAAQPPLQDRL